MRKITYRKWEIINPDFDQYLALLLDGMNSAQKAQLPTDLSFKISRGSSSAVNTLTFVQKIWLLNVVFERKISIYVQDDSKGISFEDYLQYMKFKADQEGPKSVADLSYKGWLKLQQSYRGKGSRLEALQDFKAAGDFMLGAQDLMNRMEYANLFFCTGLYKLIADARTTVISRSKGALMHMNQHDAVLAFFRFLVHYEGNKRRLVDFDISPAEWYALIYFYGEEHRPTDFYNEAFKYAYRSNKTDLGKALRQLQLRGYLNTRGKHPKIWYFMTPKGKDLVIKLLERIFFDYLKK